MSKSIQSLIDELVDAVQNGNQNSAQDLASELKAAYSNRRKEEQKLVDKSSIARRDLNISEDEQEKLANFLEVSSDTTMKRAAFMLELASTVASIEDGEDPDNAFEGTAERLKTSESSLETEKRTTQEVVEKASIDPSAEILSVDASQRSLKPNGSIVIEIVVANVGDEAANDVTIEIETTAGLSTNDSIDFINTLSSDKEVTRTYEVFADGTGDQRIDIIIDSDNAGKDIADIDVSITAQSGLSRFDQDGTGRINRDDVIAAITAYNAETTIGGKLVKRGDVIDVITAYNANTDV